MDGVFRGFGVAGLLVLAWCQLVQAEPLQNIYEARPDVANVAQLKQFVIGRAPKQRSIAVEQRTFEGAFTPADAQTTLAVYSDDGCDVYIDGQRVLNRLNTGQALVRPDHSVHGIDFNFVPGQVYAIRVVYSNIRYLGPTDIDGVTLYSIGGQGGTIASIDLDIDSDNNDDFGLPQQSAGEDQIEDDEHRPGRVVLVNNANADADAIPDFADGYDLVAGAMADDACAGSQFVPVVVSLGQGVDLATARLRVSYDASGPTDLGVNGADIFARPAQGRLRLWTKPADAARDASSVADGGDYLPPGTYTAAQLGLSAGATVIWFAETIRPSAGVADVRVHIELLLDAEDDQAQTDDAVRITSSQIDIEATHLLSGNTFSVYGMAALGLPNVSDDDNGAPGPTGLLRYRVKLADPRAGLDEIQVGTKTLSLTADGAGKYVTPGFVVMTPEAKALLAADEVYRLFVGNDELFRLKPTELIGTLEQIDYADVLEIEYNPRSSRKSLKPTNLPKAYHEIEKVVSDVVIKMEADGWVPDNPADHGAFGKAVHAKVTAKLQGKSNWLMDVYVLKHNNQIMSIGQWPAGFHSSAITQVDAIALLDDYRPTVDDVLDPAKIEVIDIKTSVSGGSLSTKQKNALKAVSGNRRLGLIRSSRTYVNGSGWVTSKSVGRTIKAISFIGFVAAGVAIVTIDDYEEEYQAMADALAQIEQAQGDANRRLAGVEAVEAINRYLSNFVPDDTVLNGTTYYALLAVLTSD
jgi:hypothetical protein